MLAILSLSSCYVVPSMLPPTLPLPLPRQSCSRAALSGANMLVPDDAVPEGDPWDLGSLQRRVTQLEEINELRDRIEALEQAWIRAARTLATTRLYRV